ncbi:MAG: RAMP superfamily CRISPR-associated protein [Halothece sp.]
MPENKALERPIPRSQNRPNRNNPPNRRQNHGGNGGGNRNRGGGNGNGGNNNNPKPSPWLNPDDEPQPDQETSFIEYLRWMRPPEHPQKDGTKVEILNYAQNNPDYQKRLQTLNKRTRAIAQDHFTVKTTWRVRVGGHRGPENILLPAFDHLGVPYLPSSTLRGVARTQAIREMMAQEGIPWKTAEEKVAPYFGSINASEGKNKAGKVVFLDAYPVPCKNAGVTMDMTNNIWNWDNNQLVYSPNPNSFFSLKDAEFCIGLRLGSNCQDQAVLKKVKQWLIQGLNAGVGSQINTGYGQLTTDKNKKNANEFLRVSFGLEGQLIHGCQSFTQWNWNHNINEWQMRGNPQAEVRPVAFKSMLRYWFRAFAFGVLSPPQVQEWEARIFGAIQPQKRGFLEVRLNNGKLEEKEARNNNDPRGQQSGVLILGLSSEIKSFTVDPPFAPLSKGGWGDNDVAPIVQNSIKSEEKAVKLLIENLTWMMFQLGGIGQGARRPCHRRQNNPWFRGSTFIAGEEDFWEIPEDIKEFRNLFRQKLTQFYSALGELTGKNINPKSPLKTGNVTKQDWQEAVDQNCQIVVCSGESQSKSNKLFALNVLHDPKFKFGDRYNGFLCGKVGQNPQPSPVWIADLDDFQVVTVFGATADPRRKYLRELRDRAFRCLPIFPLS